MVTVIKIGIVCRASVAREFEQPRVTLKTGIDDFLPLPNNRLLILLITFLASEVIAFERLLYASTVLNDSA